MMIWTTRKPTEPGWYWYKEKQHEEYVFAVNRNLCVMLPSVPHPHHNRSQVTNIPVSMFNGSWSSEPIKEPEAS